MWFEKWISVGRSLLPRCEFVEQLRARLFEEAVKEEEQKFALLVQKVEIPTSDLVLRFEKPTVPTEKMQKIPSQSPFFFSFFTWFWRFGMGFGGLAAAFFIVFPFFSVAPSAAVPSLLQNIQGSVLLYRQGTEMIPSEKEEIVSSDVVMTKEGSAEIIFFEGTAVRLAAHTKIVVENLAPHPFLFASGGVKISLEEGKIWVKTFHKNIEDMGVVVATPNAHVFPSRAAFFVAYENGMNHVAVYENSVQILAESLSGVESRDLSKGDYLPFSFFDIPEKNEKNDIFDSWIQNNLQKDILYTKEFIQNLTVQTQEKLVIEEMTEKMRQFFAQNPSNKEVEKLFSNLNSLVMLSELEENKSDVMAQMEELSAEIDKVESQGNVSVTEEVKNITQEAKKTVLVKKNMEKKLPTRFSSVSNSSSLSVPMAFHEVVNVEIPLPSDTPKTAKEVYENYVSQQKTEKIESAVQSFSSQVNVYSYETARENQAKLLIEKIDAAPENIELLKAIEENSPRDVKRFVRQKRIQAEKKAEVLYPSASEILPDTK